MMKGRPKMGLSGWMAGHIICIKTRQKKIEVNFSILLIVAVESQIGCVGYFICRKIYSKRNSNKT